MKSRWQYFSEEELSCQRGACPFCGGQMLMDDDTMRKLVAIRRETGIPMPITSGYRCPTHNSEVSATGDTGPHTTGHAVDVAVSYENAFYILSAALRFGMTGIGVKQKGDVRFLHLDDLTEGPRPRVWSY